MTIKSLVDALMVRDNKFYSSSGNYEYRVHVRRYHTPRVSIPSKSGKHGDYNYCDVAFAHLYENTQTRELFWFEGATNSQHVRGHKCISYIFTNILSSLPVKIEGKMAKKILDIELEKIVDYLIQINKNSIKMEDLG